ITEILDYLRVLFARAGEVYSHRTGEKMHRHSLSDMVDGVSALPVGTAIGILAPVVRRTPGDHAERLTALARDGFVRVVVDGRVLDLAEPITLDPAVRHDIDVYVDRLKSEDGVRSRLAEYLQ